MLVEKIKKIIDNAFEKAGYACDCSIIESNRPDLCDYQCDDCFKLAKVYHVPPQKIGNAVVDMLKKTKNIDERFSKIEFANPGFINLTLSDNFINNSLIEIGKEENFGLLTKTPKTYFLDYGGPNIAKPLHVGHLRSAIVGESVKRILNYAGNKTICDVHLGDYGLQIGEVIFGLKERNIQPNEISLEILEEIYPEISARCKDNENLKNECAQITKDLQDGNLEYKKYWRIICEISGNDIKRLYKYLDVSFDLWEGESSAYKYLPQLFKKYYDDKKLILSEGAYIIPVSKETDPKELPPLIFRKSNGAYLYGSTDIATIYERREKFDIDKFLYFADLRQELHFEQVFRSCEILNLGKREDFEYCGFGTVNGKDGKPFKTRAGNSPKLDSLFEQVKDTICNEKENLKNATDRDLNIIANAIIKFADLQNNRTKDYIFDIEKFSKLSGKTGPYILYTYLRLKKILDNEICDEVEYLDNIVNQSERDLKIAILGLEKSFAKATNEKMPSYICDYLYNVCNFANNFYENNRIKTEQDEKIKKNWLKLIDLTTKIIKCLLNLLIIDTPSIM